MTILTRVRSIILIVLAFLGKAQASDQDQLTATETEAFRALVAREIYSVFPRGNAFVLTPEKLDFVLNPKYSLDQFAFDGQRPYDVEAVRCSRAAAFNILSRVGDEDVYAEKGRVRVGVCPRQRDELAKAVKYAVGRFNALLESARHPPDEDERKRTGLIYEHIDLPQGEYHYFPIISVGHGVGIAPTAVLLSDKDAIVIQTEFSSLCNSRSDKPKLCTNTINGLSELAARLHANVLAK